MKEEYAVPRTASGRDYHQVTRWEACEVSVEERPDAKPCAVDPHRHAGIVSYHMFSKDSNLKDVWAIRIGGMQFPAMSLKRQNGRNSFERQINDAFAMVD